VLCSSRRHLTLTSNPMSTALQVGTRWSLVCATLVLCAGCAMVPLVPDGSWHTLVSLQVPNQSRQFEVEATTALRPDCDRFRVPSTTQIRIIQLESFQRLDTLPNTLDEAKPRPDGIPIPVADSGPYDLTLMGARRLVPLITGKQLIARSWDRCTALRVVDRTVND
jgi:hypothetical protein